MKIKHIIIVNFRAIEALTLDLDGSNVEVIGENGTGKSSIANAFTWLLFGKIYDGQNEISKFTIQNKDKVEEETIVEVCFEEGLTLKKVNKRKMVKKNGFLEKVYEGNTNEFYINGVSQRMKDYNAAIEKLTNEETFKLLTNVTYFGTLDWKKKRQLLLGNKETDIDKQAQLIESLKATERKTSKEIEELEIRTRENIENLKKYDNLKFDISEIEKLIDRKKQAEEKKINSQKMLNEDNEKIHKDIAELQEQKREIDSQIKDIMSLEMEKQKKARLLDQFKLDLQSVENYIQNGKKELESFEKDIEECKKLFYETRDKEYVAGECPFCNQPIKEKYQNKFKEEFVEKKNKQLDYIVNKGKQVKEKLFGQ